MKSNACPRCGCYVPDDWDRCPACERRVLESQWAAEENQPTTWINGGGGAGIVNRNPYGVGCGGASHTIILFK